MSGFDRRELAAVFAGGLVGTLARFALLEALPHGALEWPWPTFIANLAGAFALGWVVVHLEDRLPEANYRLRLLGTGFCGGLTTFSTMQLELVRMLDGGDPALAFTYAATSILAGLAAVVAGMTLARREAA